MKLLTEQRVIWEGQYFGIDIKVYSNEHTNFTGAAFLATDGDGELRLHWDEPFMVAGDNYWDSSVSEDCVPVAQFEDVASDFAENSLMEIQCS